MGQLPKSDPNPDAANFPSTFACVVGCVERSIDSENGPIPVSSDGKKAHILIAIQGVAICVECCTALRSINLYLNYEFYKFSVPNDSEALIIMGIYSTSTLVGSILSFVKSNGKDGYLFKISAWLGLAFLTSLSTDVMIVYRFIIRE
ncbi:unnamed protein product [Bursaphelenchus okinawaensis]|uniref:Uncharacterized protein n=1 Tax=Bursaphelenchus okinawaensis TaxID=465554 RepID=A0A811KUI0_9BILA|nr:unnamed protein product [Bursaphelenchus okinawaensis]CAG9111259.1 unnamed protein product [Bursaphelenchus okinawaensis]